jgi:hypothetical protein
MFKTIPFMVAILATACNGEESKADLKDIPEDPRDIDDTSITEDCEITILDTSPSTGAIGWFYRDPITLTFSEANPDIAITATSSSGEEAVSFEWDDSRMNATIMSDSGTWSPAETYNLAVALCGNTPTLEFTTSEFGSTLEVEEAGLIGKTYFIDLSTANYIEPPGVGTLLSFFIDTPLLFGVAVIDGDIIDFEAALGDQDDVTGEWQTYGSNWNFSGADFSDSPYFEANTDLLSIPYGDVEIPVYGFSLTGTFSPDGNSIGFAVFSGLGDTSNMGVLMNLGNDPGAVCEEVLGSVGIECEECPEGGKYCVQLTGEIDEADVIPGLDITQ